MLLLLFSSSSSSSSCFYYLNSEVVVVGGMCAHCNCEFSLLALGFFLFYFSTVGGQPTGVRGNKLSHSIPFTLVMNLHSSGWAQDAVRCCVLLLLPPLVS